MVDIFIAIFLFYLLAVFLVFMIMDATNSEGLEFVNPIWLYKKYKVNWFGAMVLAITYTAIVLPYALGYWFYKLCTVGRK